MTGRVRSIRSSPARRRLVGAGLGFVIAAMTACATVDTADDEAPAVRPFSEVQASDFAFETDPTDAERGVFRVTTTEPMICAIAWGETEELGNLNNSLAMSGTGIVEHDVFLPGAMPGRTYFFRVQGATADGTLYQSDMATFTLPDAAPAADQSDGSATETNLAIGATVVEVSSEFNEAFAAANAIDDAGTTEWSSDGDGDEAFLTIDLGAPGEVAGVEFVTRSMADGTAIVETFTVTVDGAEVFGPFPAGSPAEARRAAVETTGQVFRFDVDTSTGGNVGAVEIRVLASS